MMNDIVTAVAGGIAADQGPQAYICMQHFFKESMKLQKDMKKCEAAVEEELKKVQVITDRQEEVAKLDDLSIL